MLKYQKGLSLIELVITLFVASVMMGAVFVLIKSYGTMGNKIKANVDMANYTTQFIDIFSDEISSASQTGTTDAVLVGAGTIGISYIAPEVDVDPTDAISAYPGFSQQVTYTVKALTPARASSLAEKGIYKTKAIDGITVYSDQLILAGVSTFSCATTVNTAPYIGGLLCSLDVYADRTDLSKLKNYTFYTNAENQP